MKGDKEAYGGLGTRVEEEFAGGEEVTGNELTEVLDFNRGNRIGPIVDFSLSLRSLILLTTFLFGRKYEILLFFSGLFIQPISSKSEKDSMGIVNCCI